MFEETNNNSFCIDRVFGRVKLEVIQATYAGGVAVQDTANSSPGTTISGTATLTLTFKPGTMVHFMQPIATGTQITGRVSAFNAAAGTATMVTSALPANGERIFIALYVGRTG